MSRRRSSLADAIQEVSRAKNSIFRKFVNSVLKSLNIWRKSDLSLKNRLFNLSDSILGTSLHDDLLQALPSNENEIYEAGAPIYIQPPEMMGNSLAAISARNQLAWETRSERSRLSSSSDSCGPVVSFGHALRAAMDCGGNDGFNDSACTSMPENSDELDTSSSSRKSSKCSSVAAETTEKLCRIPREKGLDVQDFRCAMCKKSVGGTTFSKFETCGMDGMYYCTECMRNGGKSAIPARVLMDWDWRERLISDRGRSWIEANREKPFINVLEKNPKLYSHVSEMEATRNLREKLQFVSMYLFNCRESVAEDFRRRVWPKEYLHNDIHKYSFSDLCDVKSGSLQKKLKILLNHAVSHVMNCTLCRQKGFICELCSVNDIIYPFQTEETHRCTVCSAVFHKQCWSASSECPKCVRRHQFELRRAQCDEPCEILAFQP
ncbi:unnamed protein product [Caenorhabditis bovis]|uniref:Rubicon Homology domain-containing protein n=1 Tax=Caenorhabditis bovis TaxID=2654633 RepID=A0A8S1EXH0_9PELO|nr:unnamed protein product [Caenorhabditis bovis]